MTQLLEDGTYIRTPNGIVDYAARWAYGYIVALHPVRVGVDLEKLPVGTLFGIWTDPESNELFIDIVKHVSTLQQALELAEQTDQYFIWDLRDSVSIYIGRNTSD